MSSESFPLYDSSKKRKAVGAFFEAFAKHITRANNPKLVKESQSNWDFIHIGKNFLLEVKGMGTDHSHIIPLRQLALEKRDSEPELDQAYLLFSYQNKRESGSTAMGQAKSEEKIIDLLTGENKLEAYLISGEVLRSIYSNRSKFREYYKQKSKKSLVGKFSPMVEVMRDGANGQIEVLRLSRGFLESLKDYKSDIQNIQMVSSTQEYVFFFLERYLQLPICTIAEDAGKLSKLKELLDGQPQPRTTKTEARRR
jgi:hypothetical protein